MTTYRIGDLVAVRVARIASTMPTNPCPRCGAPADEPHETPCATFKRRKGTLSVAYSRGDR